MSLIAAQLEVLRFEVLNFLAPRRVAAFNASQIGDRLRVERKMDFPFTDTDVSAACDRLIQCGFVDPVLESTFSATPHYQATGKGILMITRWRLDRGME